MTELASVIENLGQAFEEFKKTNDERLNAIEKGRGSADVAEKLTRINDDLDLLTEVKERLEKLENRSNRIGNLGGDELQDEYKDAFRAYVTKGKDDGLAELMQKAMSIGVDADGGYGVPEDLDRSIMELLRDESPMRQLCSQKTVSNEAYKKLVNIGGTDSGWVGETAPRPETNTSQLTPLAPVFGELYANPASTQTALDDVMFDVEAFLKEEVVTEFAEQENMAFLAGDGADKPSGILNAPMATTIDSVRAFGTLQYLVTGAAGAFPATDPHETLIDLVYSIKKGYRKNATFMLNRLTLAEIRKMKDGDGNLIWKAGLEAGQPSTLLGYPLEENEDMPDIAADSNGILFGDFKRNYLIVDRIGTRTLRDPFTNKPYVHFYTTKRVGGMLVDSNAMKVLRFSV
ncbi:MAG: phage major capsid protein [Candidatus Thiodiazotropha sp. (ex Epidulcina cf. delphinae)]|nr:phage major capsid protein [Candidatus Thiodiazotropha sp. (ex Epidulcina cf. delphinae)]